MIRAGSDCCLAASSFHFSPGLPALKSKDLVHRTIVGHVLARLPFGLACDMVPPCTLSDGTSEPVTGQFAYAAHGASGFVNAGGPIRLASFSWWKDSRPAVFTWICSDADEPKSGGAARPVTRDWVDVDRVRVVTHAQASCTR